ncbi:MAG: putative sulfate/molybdate transporter [Dehalococcoidales bacterium]
MNSFRFNLHELGGALGDLGTLLPLAVALITLNHMNATSVFLVVGLAYIVAGVFYRLPMPVQPLKAVAAIAIAGGLSPNVISASGLVMSAFLLLMAGTGAISYVAKLFPKVIIRGIQLGVGLLLVKAGLVLVSKHQVIIGGDDGFVTLVNLSIPAGWLIALALGTIFILFLRSKKLPASLALIALGVPVSLFWGSSLGLSSLHFGLSLPMVAIPSLANLSAAVVLLVIPQIPLTLGNAVFATADTAKTYFGPQAKRVTPKALLTTMGAVNLGAGLLGGMPICHGSGGLTAHFRLGARTGGAALAIGIPFLAMALFLDGNVVPIFALVPYAVLGVLVIFVGVQHSLLIRDLRGRREILVALAVAIPGLLTANLAIGLASGICLHLILTTLSRSRGIWSHLWSMARRKARLAQSPHGNGKTGPVSSGVSRISSSQ